MMDEVVWTLGAEIDLQSIYDQIEEYREGAGDEFVVLVMRALGLLKRFPEMGSVYKGPIRKLLLNNRRHGLFYAVEHRGIILHAIIDLRGDDEAIRRRFRQFIPPPQS